MPLPIAALLLFSLHGPMPADLTEVVEPEVEEVAINPNISFGTCQGGAQSVSVRPSMAQRTVSGNFSGIHYAEDFLQAWCYGYMPDAPQVCISVPPGGGYFAFEVIDGDGIDTVIALTSDESAGFVSCDDDGGDGLLSRLDTWLDAGEYYIYVGTYSSGYSGRFTMTVSSSSW